MAGIPVLGATKMNKAFFIILIATILLSCRTKNEQVILSSYSTKMNLVFTDTFNLVKDSTSLSVKYSLYDANSVRLAPSYIVPIDPDSSAYYEDLRLNLVSRKTYAIAGTSYEVLKYEDDERTTTLFLNQAYGPLLIRGNHYKGHETWERTERKERLLIQVIRNDTLGFGGI